MPIRDSFDWIGGTSTGGILALAIGHGQSYDIISKFVFAANIVYVGIFIPQIELHVLFCGALYIEVVLQCLFTPKMF